VQFASRKVAAVSGDARRALDICRRAVELAEQETLLPAPATAQGQESQAPDTPSKTLRRQKPSPSAGGPTAQQQKKGGIVTIAMIKRAINEATSTPLAASLRALPLASKVFLAALLARLRRTGIAEATLADVVDEARRMAVSGTGSGCKLVERWLLLLPSPTATTAGVPVSEGVVGGEGLSTPARRGRQAAGLGGKNELERPSARVVGLGLAARELAEAGIVGLENRHGDRVGRVRLGVSEDEVQGALREDGECVGLGVGG